MAAEFKVLKLLSRKVLNKIIERSFASCKNDKISNILMNLPVEKRSAETTRIKLTKIIAADELKENNRTVFLQMLGSGKCDTPRTLHFYTTRKRFLFNCGEGTQRVANEHKINLARWENIFFTRNTWENTGGLLGLAKTAQTIGMKKLTIYGPPGIENIFSGAECFITFKFLHIEFKGVNVFEDDSVQIKSVSLSPDDSCISYICTLKSNKEFKESFIVVECPSSDILGSLYNLNNLISSENISAIFHLSSNDILNQSAYQKWMKRFNCEHIVFNNCNRCSEKGEILNLQKKLHELDRELFPLFYFQSQSNSIIPNLSNVHLTDPLRKIFFRPEFLIESVDRDLDLRENNYESTSTCLDNEYPYIVFLGTNSTFSSVTRNVSSILMCTSESNYILLDCGEGTYAQLCTLFDENQVAHILKNLSVIFISHHHADHHLGLIKLLQERSKVGAKNNLVYLLASSPVDQWLENYDRFVEPISNLFTLICNDSNDINIKCSDLQNAIKISPVNVDHCRRAKGIVITTQEQWKLVYSGDSRPSQTLIDAGKGCDLLIHEATMDDEFLEEAKAMNHSTISEAIEVGKQMCAKYTILTHFNQRYAPFPVMSIKNCETVSAAFDFMKVSPKTLPKLGELNCKLKLLYANEYEDNLLRRNHVKEYWKSGNKEFL